MSRQVKCRTSHFFPKAIRTSLEQKSHSCTMFQVPCRSKKGLPSGNKAQKDRSVPFTVTCHSCGPAHRGVPGLSSMWLSIGEKDRKGSLVKTQHSTKTRIMVDHGTYRYTKSWSWYTVVIHIPYWPSSLNRFPPSSKFYCFDIINSVFTACILGAIRVENQMTRAPGVSLGRQTIRQICGDQRGQGCSSGKWSIHKPSSW